MSFCRSVRLVAVLGNAHYAHPAGRHSSLKSLKILSAVFIRGVHSQKITPNLQYISNDALDLKIDKKTLKSEPPLERPLCVMLSWMASKRKHLMKYADIYLDLGFDVTTVNISPLQLMFPTRGSQVIAAELMSFLESNEHRPVVLHGFSVGAYVWAELLVLALQDLDRYQPVLDRVAAQVWDSPADVEEMPNGLSHSLFPNNLFMQRVIKAYAKMHMKVLYRVATQYYWRATQAYHEPPCTAPSLFLVSETDPISPARRARRASQLMTAMGIKVNWQCWEASPHVLHYSHHRDEYLAALYSHLEECGLLHTKKKDVAALKL